jgi:hypothetical protein
MPAAPGSRSLDANVGWRKTLENPTSFPTGSNASSLTPLAAFPQDPSLEGNLYSGNR